jgi:hypothetical protein
MIFVEMDKEINNTTGWMAFEFGKMLLVKIRKGCLIKEKSYYMIGQESPRFIDLKIK